MTVSPDQFKDFVYRVKTDEDGTTAAAAQRIYNSLTGGEFHLPVGSVSLYRTSNVHNNEEQAEINGSRPLPAGRSTRRTHWIDEDPRSGQMRWQGGNMSMADLGSVGWLGMSQNQGSKKALMNMTALAVHAHGEMPRADYQLSYDGAAMARGAMRKFGMKAHPNNPTATGSFAYDEHPKEADEEASLAAFHAWKRMDGTPLYEHHEVDDIRKQVTEQYRVRPELTEEEQKDRARRPGKGQLRLF